MLHAKFHKTEPRVFLEEDFFNIFQTQDPVEQRKFGFGDHYLNKLGKGLLFQAPEPCSSREKNIFQTPNTPPQGHFGPKDYHLNNFGGGLLDNASY